MKVISFLGVANYQATTYYYRGQERLTRFFPTALAQFFAPEAIHICVTPTVQQHANLQALRSELQTLGVDCLEVPIPEGHSEADLWEIFDRLTSLVETGETVIFDVTHSFRSLPMLAFLAVAYLKAARQLDQKARGLLPALETMAHALLPPATTSSQEGNK